MNYFYEPDLIKQFKKESLKINPVNVNHEWKMYRISNKEFITYSKDVKYAKWYNLANFHYPKILPVNSCIKNMEIVSKNAYMTDEKGQILIYDLLNEQVVK